MISYALLLAFAKLLKEQSKITIRHAKQILSLDTPSHPFKACMQKGVSHIYLDPTPLELSKTPFNLALERYASNAKIVDCYLENEDRILKIVLECATSYKKVQSVLQLEFTGKHSNAILLSPQGVVLEALHFVSLEQSVRPVLKNTPLSPLEKRPFKRLSQAVLSTPALLEALQELHAQTTNKQLESQRNGLKNTWHKKQESLKAILNTLASPKELEDLSHTKQRQASLILCHLHALEPKSLYQGVLCLENEQIPLPKNSRSLSDAANKLFKEAKKCQQRALHITIQQENLESKIAFLQAKIDLLPQSNLDELRVLTPSKQSKRKKPSNWESFEIEGVRVGIGRNESENRALLKEGRSGDTWAHIKDKPSAHMLLFTHPNRPSTSLLHKACHLLAKLTYAGESQQALKVVIDYTQKKHVKFTQKGDNKAFVTYTHFSSVVVAL
ncbi:NFACT family protein [Helicobacter heilmannii]|uniref:NFACT family protein n=1 Tax=Helicobacter heilmannii TaxID=35817 RepID=UPI000CF0B42A|nr:NFACT family protein [Helicobacter heilmannii]GMB94321.1 Fibronectin/fibrinogen-binding protein [Helicobacter heilmannii]